MCPRACCHSRTLILRRLIHLCLNLCSTASPGSFPGRHSLQRDSKLPVMGQPALLLHPAVWFLLSCPVLTFYSHSCLFLYSPDLFCIFLSYHIKYSCYILPRLTCLVLPCPAKSIPVLSHPFFCCLKFQLSSSLPVMPLMHTVIVES